MKLQEDLSAQTSMDSDFISQARALVAQMTLEEKALLLSGDGWWKTHRIDRLNVPSVMMTDGPHGVRKVEGAALAASVPATCFPTASALASAWNTDLIREVGMALAEECQANDVQILLGPGVNMKRSPLGGRNFEYFSEDPVLAGKLAAAYIQGVQSQGVGTSLKHYAANNQEFERMAASSNVDERTMHEIYLPAFELAVKEAQPWSVMAAYNPVNGVYATENEWLLQGILRARWGFQGLVVSDWGAIHDRIEAVNAGCNLEMPGSGEFHRDQIIQAARTGRIPPATLDEVVVPLLAVILKAKALHRPDVAFNPEGHDALARRAAGESVVLLKNDGALLPLDPAALKSVALIGAFAKTPRYQGAGSSQVNPTRISTAYEELLKLMGKDTVVRYAAGYAEEGETTSELLDEARQHAKEAEVAVVFAGLPDSYESEGFDRASLELPPGHNELIEAVAAVQPNTVVVLMNGSAVTMPWAGKVGAIIEAWLGGQAGGGAVADALAGRVNPSGKLAETFPARLEDTPAYPDFPARDKNALYGERCFIGYRHYDARKVAPLFPFGFGLSYTTFAYSDLRVSASSIRDTEGVTVELEVKNTGQRAGKEVVQLYVREQHPKVARPEKELKAFTKVALEPGEEKTVRFRLEKRDFACYDLSIHDWAVNSGTFELLAGGSSRDLPLRQMINVEATGRVYPPLTRDSLLKEFAAHPKGKAHYATLANAFGMGNSDEEATADTPDLTPEEAAAKKKAARAVKAFLDDMPAYKVSAFSEGRFTPRMLDDILRQAQ